MAKRRQSSYHCQSKVSGHLIPSELDRIYIHLTTQTHYFCHLLQLLPWLNLLLLRKKTHAHSGTWTSRFFLDVRTSRRPVRTPSPYTGWNYPENMEEGNVQFHTQVNQRCRKQEGIETTPWRRIPVWRGRGTLLPVIFSSRLACVLSVSVSPPANTQHNTSYITRTWAMDSRFLQINPTGEWSDENHETQRHSYKIQSGTQRTVLLRNYSNVLFYVYKKEVIN